MLELTKLKPTIYSLLQAGNYMFKVNNRNTRIECEICTKFFCASFDNFEQVNAGWTGSEYKSKQTN